MFCLKCGQELDEDSKFCPKCGAPVDAPQEKEEVAEAVEQQAAASVEPVYVMESEKSSKKGIFIGLGVVAVVAVVAALACVILGVFDTPQKMLAKAINNSKDSFISSYDKGYSSIEKIYKDVNGDMTVTVESTLGDQTKDMISNLGSTFGVDLSWIESANAEIAVDFQEKQLGLGIKGSLNGQEIGTINAVVDADTEKAYISVPEVSDAAFSGDLDMSAEELVSVLSAYTEAISNYSDRYPEPKQLDKVMSKYTDVFIQDLSNAEMEKTKTELTAGEVTAKYTQVSVKLDDKTAAQLTIDLIDTLKSDNEIKEIMRPTFEAQLQSGLYNGYFDDYDDYWDTLLETLDDARESAQEELDAIAEDPEENEDLGVLNFYIDRTHSFKGLSFENEEDETKIECYVPVSGHSAGILIRVEEYGDEQFVFQGQGEVENNLFNGSYTCSIKEEDAFSVQVEDFDIKEFSDNHNSKGKLVFNLDPSMADVISDPSAKAFTLADYAFSFDTDDLNGSYDLDILAGDESLLDIKFAFKMEDVPDMTIPSKVYDIDNMSDDEAFEMLKNVNLSSLIGNLQKSGVPEEYYEKLTTLSDAIASGDEFEMAYAIMDLTGQGDDYYYDDYYYDDYDYDSYESELSYLASLSYEEFAEYYREYYDSSASDSDLRDTYDYLVEYFGE